jgi:hypothetical protein
MIGKTDSSEKALENIRSAIDSSEQWTLKKLKDSLDKAIVGKATSLDEAINNLGVFLDFYRDSIGAITERLGWDGKSDVRIALQDKFDAEEKKARSDLLNKMKIPSSNLSQEGTISAIQEYIENQIEIKAEERVNATKLELERSVKTASNLANVVGDLKAELKGVEKKNKDDQKLFKQKEEALKEDLRILRESKSLATSEASGAANIRANSRTKIEDPQQKLPLIVERIVDLVKSEKPVSSDEFPEV